MLTELGVVDAVHGIRTGDLTSVELVTACIEKIQATDDRIGAWVHLEPERALGQARAMDSLRQRGLPLGALHGVPVGVKDIFDTSDMPTAYGSRIHEGRRPAADSAVVEKLREAGAVVLGKTVSTEFAFMHPAATANLHDRRRTPGGSSSGSAAAVAARHVPMAIGSQTNGSTIRPASYCGIYGFKPSRGIISRRGALQTSKTLDQVGVFARTLQDVALLGDVLGGYDAGDEASYLRPRPGMLEGYGAEPPVEPCFAWFELPFNDRLSPAAREGFEELLEALGDRVERIPTPASVAGLVEHQKVIHEYELCQHLREEIEHHWDDLSEALRTVVERARGYTPAQYQESLAMVSAAEAYFAGFFCDYDAIVAPAAAGEAPELPAGTGDPVFCTIWTFCGLPCLCVPLLEGESGLPVGAQLIGSADGDDRLLRSTRWLVEHLRTEVVDNA
jgi:Asp-tRNA(Asn)/Glu-tRNA(Gln) amidotransferase A subunit family amidase